MKLNSLQLLRSNNSLNLARTKIGKKSSAIGASLLTLATAAICYQPEKAAAVDLDFSSCTGTSAFTDIDGSPAFGGNVLDCAGVATGVNARITATVTSPNYSFGGHIPNYSSVNDVPVVTEPNDDLGSLYQIATGQTGFGKLTYKIDLFDSSQGTGYSTAYTAPSLNLLMYDVDGESDSNGDIVQTEAVRIAKNSGFIGYQVGNTSQALSVSQDATSILFSGKNNNVSETDISGIAIFYFQDVNSVTFDFEANSLTAINGINEVFTSIDGDLSLLSALPANSFTPVTAVPEPFTVIGTIVGGTAALRLRKKLKSTTKS